MESGEKDIPAIWVCAAVKNVVFKEFTLGKVIEIRDFWSRIKYHFPRKLISSLNVGIASLG